MSRLPALLMLAAVYLRLLRFVLPEVKTLSWMDLRPNSNLKIFVRNLSIFIKIKFVKQVLELLISIVEAPMLEVEPKLCWLDCP